MRQQLGGQGQEPSGSFPHAETTKHERLSRMSARRPLWGATIVWAGASIVFMLIGAFGPWETGRADIWQPGPHISTRGVEGDAGDTWLVLAPAIIAAVALILYAYFRDHRGSKALPIIALLAGAFMTLVTFAVLTYTPIGCGDFLGPVCEQGEAAIREVGWGVYVTMLASISLTVASVTLLIQPRR